MFKKCFLTCALSSLMFGQGIVKNAGFEELNANGGFADWPKSNDVYTVDTAIARTGKNSLHFKNMNADKYVLYSQKINLDKSKRYVFGVWVRSSNINGAGPTACVEFYRDEDGKDKYISGTYPSGVCDTNGEWQLIRGNVPKVPEKATKAVIVLYCRQGTTGEAWFDDVFIDEFEPSLIGTMTTDHYRHITDGSEVVKVFAGINTDDKKISSVKGTNAVLNVLNKSGKSVFKLRPADGDGSYFMFELNSKKLKVGEYSLQISMKNPKTGKEEKNAITLKRVEKYPERKSYIDKHKRLIVDGKPFFPLGMYFSSVNKGDIDIYKDSAFNCVMPYDWKIEMSDLDYAYKNGISVIYSVKDIYPGRYNLKNKEEADNKTRELIKKYKDHPGIIAWYANDEMPISEIENLTAKRNLLEEIDPGHPAWVVLYQYNEIRDYVPSFDVIGTDPYPISNKANPEKALEWARTTTNGAYNCHANWMVPQVFNWASYWNGYQKTEKEILSCRAPSFEEMKAMTWMCISGGANGLIYYSFFDLKKMDKLVKDGGRALRVDPFNERWPEVKKMAAEVSEHKDILLSVDKVIKVKPVQVSDGIGVRYYGKGDETWMLLVNSSNQKTEKCVFEAEKNVKIKKTALGTSVPAVNGKNITVELKPLEALFICIAK